MFNYASQNLFLAFFIDCIFAVESSLISVVIIGVPEAKAASKNTETLFSFAYSKISLSAQLLLP